MSSTCTARSWATRSLSPLMRSLTFGSVLTGMPASRHIATTAARLRPPAEGSAMCTSSGCARLEDLGQVVRRAEHLDALEAVAQLVAVVVDQPDRRVAGEAVLSISRRIRLPASPAPTISTFLPCATNEPRRGRSISERASTRAPPSRISVKTRSSSERALGGRALARRPRQRGSPRSSSFLICRDAALARRRCSRAQRAASSAPPRPAGG